MRRKNVKHAAVLCAIVGTVLVPQSVVATPAASPVLSLTCRERDSGGRVACALSGRGFLPHEALRITYTLQPAARSRRHQRVYRRAAQADAIGSFSRPPLVLSPAAGSSIIVNVQSRARRYPVRVVTFAKQRQILSWACGQTNANGQTPCRLTGSGFQRGEILTIVYTGTFLRARRAPVHLSYRRHLKANARGAFSRPPIWFSFSPTYLVTAYVNHGPVGAVPYVIAQVSVSAGSMSRAGG